MCPVSCLWPAWVTNCALSVPCPPRRSDSGGSSHSAFEPLLANGAPSQLVPKWVTAVLCGARHCCTIRMCLQLLAPPMLWCVCACLQRVEIYCRSSLGWFLLLLRWVEWVPVRQYCHFCPLGNAVVRVCCLCLDVARSLSPSCFVIVVDPLPTTRKPLLCACVRTSLAMACPRILTIYSSMHHKTSGYSGLTGACIAWLDTSLRSAPDRILE